jgi:hypothetical protein
MIAPDPASELHQGRTFDVAAALLIGTIAVLASLLAVIEVGTGQQSLRAQLEAARLTTDLSAGLQVSSLVQQSLAAQQQATAALSFEGGSRSLSALEQGDDIALQIGTAELDASTALSDALTATAQTVSGPPVDEYTSRLIEATIDELTAEVNEQNRQVDLADDADTRNTRSTLGLSFLALAGVLTSLGAVLRESRPGWFALAAAAGMSAASVAMVVLAVG